MRATLAACFVVSLLALGACEQTPDRVATASSPALGGSGGATGGTGGLGGGGGGGSGGTSTVTGGGEAPEPCDPMFIETYQMLSRVALDDCSFAATNTRLGTMLFNEIFRFDPLPINPEQDQLIGLCQIPKWFARPLAEGNPTMVMCPGYCASLNKWVSDRAELAAQCLPDAGP